MIITQSVIYIDDYAIFDQFKTDYDSYNFFEECNTDTYIELLLNDAYLEDLYMEQNKYKKLLTFNDTKTSFKGISKWEYYLNQINNTIILVEYLRSLGYRDKILIRINY